jgi:hypothetical protein
MNRAGEILGYDNVWGSARRRSVVRAVGILAGVLVAVTVPASYWCEHWFLGIYAFWVIAPPIWFFVEYFYVFGRRDDPHALELLKGGEDVAQKFWAALLVLLTGIGYFRWHLSLFHGGEGH